MGRKGFATIRAGMFVVGRIVPLHPAADVWMVTGTYTPYSKSARRQIAAAAAQQLTIHPELLRRNPVMLRKAWEIQAEYRADFIDQVGADITVRPPREAQETLREHYRRQQQRALANLDTRAAERAAKTGPAPEQLVCLPEDVLVADSIALIYDEVDGLNHYRDFGRLDALFADPALARDRTYLALLREYLNDESVAPLAIRRLVQRHPDGADPVFRALLRKPGFTGLGTGRTCSAATRRPSSTANRHPASPLSANASPNCSAAPDSGLRSPSGPRGALCGGSPGVVGEVTEGSAEDSPYVVGQ
jgi:hypothetical protein